MPRGSQMTRPRITIRRLMLGVLTLAVVLRLVIVAVQISRQPNVQTLSHLRRFRGDGTPFVYSHGTTASQFWAEYWRRSIGVKWPGGFTCSCKAEQESEMGKPTIDVETSHDMDALIRRMNQL